MPNMKFYFTPGACSLAAHILLEELDFIFEAHVVDILNGGGDCPEYREINRNGSIPSLVLSDGRVLVSLLDIVLWLGEHSPGRKLLPSTEQDLNELTGIVEFIIYQVHGQGLTRIFTPEKYTSDAVSLSRLGEQGRKIVIDGFSSLAATALNEGVFQFGAFTVVDPVLFYVEFWAKKIGIALPRDCELHYLRMLDRSSVRQVLKEEGYHSTLESKGFSITD